MVVPLAMESGEICTGQIILQPISLKSDRLLVLDIYVLFVIALATSAVELRMRLQPHTDIFGETNVDKSQ